jgi:hypothetical protein
MMICCVHYLYKSDSSKDSCQTIEVGMSVFDSGMNVVSKTLRSFFIRSSTEVKQIFYSKKYSNNRIIFSKIPKAEKSKTIANSRIHHLIEDCMQQLRFFWILLVEGWFYLPLLHQLFSIHFQ